jgi:hypothetical protein
VAAAIASYYSSSAFKHLSPGTQQVRRAVLDVFKREHGDKLIHRLSRRDAPRQGGRRVRARNPCPTGDVPSLLDGAVASGYDVPIGRTRKTG